MEPKYTIAYPFPRLSNTPQTPWHTPTAECSPMSQSKNQDSSFKRTIIGLVLLVALLVWLMHPFPGPSMKTDGIPPPNDEVDNYFSHFEGYQDCEVTSRDLYNPPTVPNDDTPKHTLYCRNRVTLLDAMSGGGRHGFERPYSPAGCHYRWYSTPEICMILERFDALVFLGDDTLKHVYAAFNMLIREDIATGGLHQSDLAESEQAACRCDNQFMKSECSNHIVTDSKTVSDQTAKYGNESPYYCDRTPHMFLPVSGSPASEDLHSSFTSLLSRDPDAYKPIPVIQSLSLGTSLSWSSATSSMDEWVSLADDSGRNVPFLWVGPNAAGHLKPPGQILSEGNNALWHYTMETTKEAKSRELDALGMYNLTLQANSWDGSHYGLKVINWLSRVEST